MSETPLPSTEIRPAAFRRDECVVQTHSVSAERYLAGAILLGAGLLLSLALTLQHLAHIGLPGCGPEGACAQAAAGPWGKIAGLPVSALGVAYFAALLTGWTLSRNGVPISVRALARAGALVSILLIGVLLAEAQFCRYCLIVHGLNLAFWVLVETSPW